MSDKPMQTLPKVRIIQDSIINGSRLTTFEVVFWRPLLAQMNTHRAFSRCYGSNRAKPASKLVDEVKTCPWGPNHWPVNEKGMVGSEEFTGQETVRQLRQAWRQAGFAMAQVAEALDYNRVHKEVVNRLLEPFSSVTGVISSTEWDNFFRLRCAKDAQPEMQDLAWEMRRAMDKSIPVNLKAGQWHLPYVSAEEREEHALGDLIKASAARCARVSYKAFDGTTSVEKDMALCDRLIKDRHLSPLEMVATPADSQDGYLKSNYDFPWIQLRKFVEHGIRLP